MDVLVVPIAEPLGATIAHQVDPFRIYRGQIRDRLGLSCEVLPARSLDEAAEFMLTTSAKVVMLAPNWREPAGHLGAWCDRMCAVRNRPRVVLMDTSDAVSSRFFGVVASVDRFLKRQLPRDLNEINRPYLGGNRLSDFAMRRFGIDGRLWNFSSPLDMAYADRVRLCWNFGARGRYTRMIRTARAISADWSGRAFDIHQRLGLATHIAGAQEWYQHYRRWAAGTLSRLPDVITRTGATRVPRYQYLLEMMRSRIVFSPFGWGEVCFRDYEAAACGALLFKPAMDHLCTTPDIFQPYVTYVPIAWDFSDLKEKIEHYLANPIEGAAIARNAQVAMERYLCDGSGFCTDLARSLEGLVPLRHSPSNAGHALTSPIRVSDPGVISSAAAANRHVLIVALGDRTEAIAAAHARGFSDHAVALKSALRVTSEFHEATDEAALLTLLTHTKADYWLLLPTWRWPAERTTALFSQLRSLSDRKPTLILDWYAPTSSPHFGVLNDIERYLKRQTYSDNEHYDRAWRGGQSLTDAVVRWLSLDIGDWYFGSPAPKPQREKLIVGWNFGVSGSYQRLLKVARIIAPAWHRRPYEFNRRLGLAKLAKQGEWYEHYRVAAGQAAEAMVGKYVCTGAQRIPRRRYLLELCRSKIVFSPFGWGEVCFRDYEAVACGSLVLKPDMSHLHTSPDIFIPYETYVPLAWDFSDLAEKTSHYLSHPRDGARISRNAREALREYATHNGFLLDVHRALRGL